MSRKLVAIVPMKAHSERVPNKNRREFNGRPLFHWILATLNATPEVDHVLVDTDSEEIAAEASSTFDAQVVDRPQELRGDFVSVNDIILHDVRQVDGDVFLQTHCTNPLLRPETISEAVRTFHESDCDSLFSVTPHQSRYWRNVDEPINHNRDELLRTQDLDPVYEENSCIYLFTQESVERRENRIGDRPKMFEMTRRESVDIDEPFDFTIAESLHRSEYGDEPDLADVVDA